MGFPEGPFLLGGIMTYLDYINLVLAEINEVPLDASQLTTARGLHRYVMNSVNRTYLDIVNTPESKWPWLQTQDVDINNPDLVLSGEQTIVTVGDEWYQIPVQDPYKDVIDWDNIYILDPEGTRVTVHTLSWTEYSTLKDRKALHDTGTPRYIIQSPDGRSMGIFPNPEEDEQHLIKFRLWQRPSRFNNADDVVPIPDQFSNVMIDGASHYAWRFRENIEQASFSFQKFERGVKDMKRVFGNQSRQRLKWR